MAASALEGLDWIKGWWLWTVGTKSWKCGVFEILGGKSKILKTPEQAPRIRIFPPEQFKWFAACISLLSIPKLGIVLSVN